MNEIKNLVLPMRTVAAIPAVQRNKIGRSEITEQLIQKMNSMLPGEVFEIPIRSMVDKTRYKAMLATMRTSSITAQKHVKGQFFSCSRQNNWYITRVA